LLMDCDRDSGALRRNAIHLAAPRRYVSSFHVHYLNLLVLMLASSNEAACRKH
jgi:hypothetical protein